MGFQMEWTDKLPDRPGWYWVAEKNSSDVNIVWVWETVNELWYQLFGETRARHLNDSHARAPGSVRWLGPIEEPVPPSSYQADGEADPPSGLIHAS